MIELDDRADDPGIGREARAPRRVAERHDQRRTGVCILLVEGAAGSRSHTEDVGPLAGHNVSRKRSRVLNASFDERETGEQDEPGEPQFRALQVQGASCRHPAEHSVLGRIVGRDGN